MALTKVTGAGIGSLTEDVAFGDSDKAIFGAGSDLSIYHDGTNSYVNNTTGNLIVQSGANAYMNVNGSENAVACVANGAVGLYYDNSEKLVTTTHGITVNGRQTILHNGASDYAMYVYNDGDNANRYGIYMQIGDDDGTGTSIFLSFVDGDGNTVGSVTFTGSTTSFNTSSDYRLKNNITDLTDATAKVKELKPKKFSWKKDKNSTLIHGFIAHEVAEVIPEAVVGEKDAMTEEVLYVDGDEIPEGKKVGDVKEASKIAPQGIDPSKLVPLLVKTIQELEARITALESA